MTGMGAGFMRRQRSGFYKLTASADQPTATDFRVSPVSGIICSMAVPKDSHGGSTNGSLVLRAKQTPVQTQIPHFYT